MRRFSLSLFFILLLGVFPAIAEPSSLSPDQEARAQEIFHGLRCMTCVSQTIADSAAPLAGDMREVVRSQLRQGASNEDIYHYMAERYGDGVLMHPPLKTNTFALWLAPLFFLLIGGGCILFYFRKSRRAS